MNYQFQEDEKESLQYTNDSVKESLQKIEKGTRRRLEVEEIKNNLLKNELSTLRAMRSTKETDTSYRDSYGKSVDVTKSLDTVSESFKRQDKTITTRDVSFRR